MAHTGLTIDAIRPMNRWNHDRIQPGWVGSVGDVNCQVRLKHSAPELPLRWEKAFTGLSQVPLGSNVQDGQFVSAVSGGGGARVYASNWQSGRSFRTRRGWRIEDITDPDMLVEPFVSSLGDYTWRDKIATVYEARRTGAQFLPIPGPYQLSPGEMARGGSTVRITDVASGDPQPSENVMTDENIQQSNGTQEAPLPVGFYGRSTGDSQGGRTGGNYSSRAYGSSIAPSGMPGLSKMR